jgi:hypothetical protein
MTIPQISKPFTGIDMAKAPDWLKPHIEGFDGAMFVGGTLGKPRIHKITRFKNGEAIDTIEVTEPEEPTAWKWWSGYGVFADGTIERYLNIDGELRLVERIPPKNLEA